MATPPVSIEEQYCGICIAYVNGTCRLNPPLVMIDRGVGVAPMTVWPTVGPDDWCRQWDAAPAAAEEPAPEPIAEDADPAWDEPEPEDEPHVAPHKKKKRR